MRSYLYTRVSTLQQSTYGQGIDRQIKTVTDYLKWSPYDLDPNDYVLLESDLGKSAYHGKNWNPGTALGDFYVDVMAGKIGECYLIVENIDRLTRRSFYEIIEKIAQLINRGVSIIEVETNTIFRSTDPMSSTILTVQLNRSFQESNRKSILAKKSHEQRRTKVSKVCPEWLEVVDGKYQGTKILDDVLMCFNGYKSGTGISQLSRTTGYTTVKIAHWLRDKRLLGTARYPSVIDPVLFKDVQIKLDSKAKPIVHQKNQNNLFSGISKCMICGSAIITDRNGIGDFYTICLGRRHDNSPNRCTSKGIKYKPLERVLLRYIKGINWNSLYGSNDTEIDQLRSKLSVLDNSIKTYKSELDLADNETALVLARIIRQKREEYEVLVQKIAGMETSRTVSIDSTLDMDDVEVRRQVNIGLRNCIKSLKLRRVDDLVLVTIEYFTDIIQHLLCIKKDTVVSESYLKQGMILGIGECEINLLSGEQHGSVLNDEYNEVMIQYWYEVFNSKI